MFNYLYIFLILSLFTILLIINLNNLNTKLVIFLYSIPLFAVLVYVCLTIDFSLIFFYSYNFEFSIFYNIYFTLGIDQLSIMYVLLTTFLFSLVVLASWLSIRFKINFFCTNYDDNKINNNSKILILFVLSKFNEILTPLNIFLILIFLILCFLICILYYVDKVSNKNYKLYFYSFSIVVFSTWCISMYLHLFFYLIWFISFVLENYSGNLIIIISISEKLCELSYNFSFLGFHFSWNIISLFFINVVLTQIIIIILYSKIKVDSINNFYIVYGFLLFIYLGSILIFLSSDIIIYYIILRLFNIFSRHILKNVLDGYNLEYNFNNDKEFEEEFSKSAVFYVPNIRFYNKYDIFFIVIVLIFFFFIKSTDLNVISSTINLTDNILTKTIHLENTKVAFLNYFIHEITYLNIITFFLFFCFFHFLINIKLQLYIMGYKYSKIVYLITFFYNTIILSIGLYIFYKLEITFYQTTIFHELFHNNELFYLLGPNFRFTISIIFIVCMFFKIIRPLCLFFLEK